MRDIWITDHFYENVDEVRREALSFEYQSARELGGSWPGRRTQNINIIAPHIFSQFTQRIYDILGWQPFTTSYFETQFQICQGTDGNSWIHQDDFHEYTHVGIVYLSPAPPVNSGTIIYSLKPDTPIVRDASGWTHSDDNNNPKFYNIKKRVQNNYNRALIYKPSAWHKSDVYFGDTFENSRLTQVCFFREDGVLPHHAHPSGNYDNNE
jgi:hypothetical protein